MSSTRVQSDCQPADTDVAPTSRREIYVEILLVAGIFGYIAALALYHGITRNFMANSDMDVVTAYFAVLVASGEPLEAFPHTGYLQALIYGAAIRLADSLGWITSSQFSVISEPGNFATHFPQVVYAGRVLSIVLGIGSAAIVWRIARLLSGDRWAALCVVALFAGSLGLGDQILVIRTELPAMFFALLAAWTLIIATRESGWRAVGFLSIAAFFCFSALLVKIQTVFLILFFPILALALADPGRGPFAPPRRGALAAAALIAIAMAGPAALTLLRELPDGKYGLYQAAIMAYVIGAIFFYARLRKIGGAWAIAGVAGVIGGLSAGQFLNEIKDSTTGFAVFNFLEAMSQYSGNDGSDGTLENLLSLPGHLVDFLARYLLPQQPITMTYPMLVIYWTAILGTVAAAVARRWRSATLCGVLLLMAIGLPTVFSIRGYLYQYRIYVEIWVILAAVLVLVQLTGRERFRSLAWAAMVGFALVIPGVQIGFNLIKPSAANTREPLVVCAMMDHTLKIAETLLRYCNKARLNEGMGVWPRPLRR